MKKYLSIEKLYNKCKTSLLDFNTTNELEDINISLGQDRALEAMNFATGIKKEGYNLFVMGRSGSGKHTTVTNFLEKEAKTLQTPNDWCYVYNFEEPEKPIALEFPSGLVAGFKKDIERLVFNLQSIIPTAFKSDDFLSKKQKIDQSVKLKQDQTFNEIYDNAIKDDLNIKYTQKGYVISPVKAGKILTDIEYSGLKPEDKQKIDQNIQNYTSQIEAVSQLVLQWSSEAFEEVDELERKTAKKAINSKLAYLKRKYTHLPKVLDYLQALEEDIIENANDFIPDTQKPEAIMQAVQSGKPLAPEPSFEMYNVNIIVHHKKDEGVPVIYEDNPNFKNLFGQIEYISQMGTLVTDFNLIKGGALHRANGGYLILDARKVLLEPYVWEALKRMLFSASVKIETIYSELGLNNTVSLTPDCIPLDIKIVFVGERDLYYMLYNYDPDFQKLFKINADFEDDILRDEENTKLYASMIGSILKQNKLLPMDKKGVAKVIEYSSRISGDSNKLSTHIRSIIDTLIEADFIARSEKEKIIKKTHILKSIEEKRNRASRIKDKSYELILDKTIFIQLQNKKAGQINGLTILDLGDMSFGEPVKITAKTRLGDGEIIDIQRHIDMSGPIHSKGVMTLSSYLESKYAADIPHSFKSTISFEQSYSHIEGDSASAAELFAILSSLSNIPIDQSFAITGSINQNGDIQAIGGVNEKIEGFFDVCELCDKDNKHSVIIPYSNIKHLMLKEEVIQAVKEKRFFIYGIKSVDEGLELLMNKKAGVREKNGKFEKNSVNFEIEKSIKVLSQKSLRQKIK